MGGKKKGGLANKLARMTDDERAKYLQRKADMEEEARRRKEQLVATFMKNKLKKEDAFSRLNLAKINQQWHQIMRADKCKEMKEEVEHLRKWIDRIVTLKNRTIKKLMDELDWQEGLYGKNFTAHFEHIDKIIEFHSKNLNQLCKQYDGDRHLLLHIGATERADLEKRTGNEIEHVKTIIHGQEVEAKISERENREEYMKKTDEILSTYRTELSQMKKEREKISCALWRQMSKILKAYVQQTDVRRSHLGELRRLDAEGAVAISTNQQLIANEEEQLEKLKHEHANLVESSEEQIKNLEKTVTITTERFFKMRKNLCLEINHDEKQLGHLSNVSNRAIEDLEKLASKGEQILQMVQTCRKLETEKEKFNRWTPFIEDDDIFAKNQHDSKSSIESEDALALIQKLGEDGARYKPKYSWEAFEKELEEVSKSSSKTSSSSGSSSIKQIDLDKPEDFNLENFVEPKSKTSKLKETSFDSKEILVHSSKSAIFVSKIRPKTAISKPPKAKYSLRQLKSEEVFEQHYTHSEEDKIFQISTRLVKTTTSTSKSDKTKTEKKSSTRPTKSAVVRKKPDAISDKFTTSVVPKSLQVRSSSAPKSFSDPEVPRAKVERPLKSAKVADKNFEVLDKLEGLWWVYNKVEMDCMKMKKEKRALLQENNKLKEIIKDVLEAAALGQSIPSAKSASTSASRKRFILSAPLSSYSIF